jgi:nucleoside-diphosphate kinase
MTNRTLILCKPDAVERGLCGEIIGRLERKGLRVVAAELRHVDVGWAKRHYEEHIGKPFFETLVTFITRSPLLAMVVEGPEGCWEVVRLITGATDPARAAPGTIRGDLAIASPENLIHASDGPDSAEREIALWFPGLAVEAEGGGS